MSLVTNGICQQCLQPALCYNDSFDNMAHTREFSLVVPAGGLRRTQAVDSSSMALHTKCLGCGTCEVY